MITDQNIQNLIVAPKEIRKRKPREGYKRERGHRRCDLILYQSHLRLEDSSKEKSERSSDMISVFGQNIKFIIFIRQNQTFIENFSVGLRCEIPFLKNTVTLIRYNGPHGSIKRSATDHHPHPHIHRITQEEIQFGNFNPKAKNIEITDRYNTFEEGLRAIFNRHECYPLAKIFS